MRAFEHEQPDACARHPQGRVTFEEFRDIIRWKPPSTKINVAEQEGEAVQDGEEVGTVNTVF